MKRWSSLKGKLKGEHRDEMKTVYELLKEAQTRNDKQAYDLAMRQLKESEFAFEKQKQALRREEFSSLADYRKALADEARSRTMAKDKPFTKAQKPTEPAPQGWDYGFNQDKNYWELKKLPTPPTPPRGKTETQYLSPYPKTPTVTLQDDGPSIVPLELLDEYKKYTEIASNPDMAPKIRKEAQVKANAAADKIDKEAVNNLRAKLMTLVDNLVFANVETSLKRNTAYSEIEQSINEVLGGGMKARILEREMKLYAEKVFGSQLTEIERRKAKEDKPVLKASKKEGFEWE